MADLLDGIARYLHGLGLVVFDPEGLVGDLFVDTMPEAPDEAVAIATYPLGLPDPLNADDELGLQVRARGPAEDPRPSRRRCQDIYSALQGLTDTALPDGTWLVLAAAQQTPSPLGKDERGRPEHVVNFRLHVVSETTHRS
ncbi:hypothetical protein BX265_4947 [Streptomyces sp. TLI_235]|nr:minor capsid protein [Streptomyces sp. TLI_235]PBC80111.1 hypothetical protein BX265_4947 [Streptomyces sp. TLI_235]